MNIDEWIQIKSNQYEKFVQKGQKVIFWGSCFYIFLRAIWQVCTKRTEGHLLGVMFFLHILKGNMIVLYKKGQKVFWLSSTAAGPLVAGLEPSPCPSLGAGPYLLGPAIGPGSPGTGPSSLLLSSSQTTTEIWIFSLYKPHWHRQKRQILANHGKKRTVW